MTLQQIGSRGLAIVLSALLCGLPECLNAQAMTSPQSQPQAQSQQQNGVQSEDQTTLQSQPGKVVPDPAQAPLAPVPSTRPNETNNPPPDAPSEVQRSQQSQTPPTTSEAPLTQQQPPAIPLGTATAQQGATRGGAASKPAGEAIAPAKQRQVHSVLIRLGLVAAGAAAVGTVVALTRGTSSIPPGAH